MPDLPAHASPVLAPQARPSAPYLSSGAFAELHNLYHDDPNSRPSTPAPPNNLLSPAFTPPATPGLSTPSDTSTPLQSSEPKSTPVDTSLDLPTTKPPKLLDRLPIVECIVRARIPTTTGAEMFLHLYQNDVDDKEHLAIVFGSQIRSASLDRERPGETEMDRMIRGAYVGRLRPGRMSSRFDDANPVMGRKRKVAHGGSKLKDMSTINGDTTGESLTAEETSPQTPAVQQPTQSESSPSQPSPESSQANVEEHDSLAPLSAPPQSQKPPLVRIHSECYTGETAWSARCDCGEQLDEAARLMSLPSTLASTGGVIVYLRQEGRGIGLASKLKAYNLQDLGSDTVEANLLLRHPADARTYGLATSILVDLGCGGERGIRLLTNNPDKVRAVEGPGREVRVRERVAMIPLSWRGKWNKGVKGVELERYLRTKVGKMGHMMEEDSGGQVA